MAAFRVIFLGNCSPLMVEESLGGGVLATCAGFRGEGASEEAAIDDLIDRVRSYNAEAVDLARSLEGQLLDMLREIKVEVDRIVGTASRQVP